MFSWFIVATIYIYISVYIYIYAFHCLPLCHHVTMWTKVRSPRWSIPAMFATSLASDPSWDGLLPVETQRDDTTEAPNRLAMAGLAVGHFHSSYMNLHELTLYSKAGSDLSQGSFTTWSNSPILFHWLKWWYLMIITSKAISTTKKKHLQYNHHDVLICFLFLIMLVVFFAHLHASMVKLPIFTAIVSDSNGSNQVPSQPIDT
jgi:hypothetical protein